MNQETNTLVRIVTHEMPNGTHYIAERRVWKTRWFHKSGWSWEAFAKVEATIHYSSGFEELTSYDLRDTKFKEISYAQHACEEWVRVMSTGKVIKIWEQDE